VLANEKLTNWLHLFHYFTALPPILQKDEETAQGTLKPSLLTAVELINNRPTTLINGLTCPVSTLLEMQPSLLNSQSSLLDRTSHLPAATGV
jgi:hypothetical protein